MVKKKKRVWAASPAAMLDRCARPRRRGANGVLVPVLIVGPHAAAYVTATEPGAAACCSAFSTQHSASALIDSLQNCFFLVPIRTVFEGAHSILSALFDLSNVVFIFYK